MKYAHTNIIAQDWKRLARFYQEALNCAPVPPERDLSGEWIDRATGLHGARITGAHLRLPGWGEDGPTLEIFHYDEMTPRPATGPNTPGFTHIAFAVDDVAAAARKFLEHGGSALGELVTRDYAHGKTVEFQYLADPEGNMIELQAWTETKAGR